MKFSIVLSITTVAAVVATVSGATVSTKENPNNVLDSFGGLDAAAAAKCGSKTCSSGQRCCTTTVRGSAVYYCTTRECSNDKVQALQGDMHPAAEASFIEMETKLFLSEKEELDENGNIFDDLSGDGGLEVPIFGGHEDGGNCYCCGCNVSCRECKRDFDVCCTN